MLARLPHHPALLPSASRAMSVWTGSFSLDYPTRESVHHSEGPQVSREADSQPSVSGWASSFASHLFPSCEGVASLPELQDVSKPERTGSPWDAYRLMAVPKRKVSPSRNGLRFQHKWLKPAFGLIKCKGCGKVTVRHRYCMCGLIAPPQAEASQGESSS